MRDSAPLRGSGVTRCLRVGLVLGLGATLLLLLQNRISGIDLADLQAAIRAVPPLHLLASFGFVTASYWAVGVQEWALHRHFATYAPARQARQAGMIASAIGQAAGFGPAIGTLDRWRLVCGPQAARLSLAAVPHAPGGHWAGRRPDSGPTRFKTAFAPQWEPLYLCAPSPCALAVTAVDIARAVLRPAPLASAPPLAHFPSNEIAPAAAAWHRMAMRPPDCQGALLRKEL